MTRLFIVDARCVYARDEDFAAEEALKKVNEVRAAERLPPLGPGLCENSDPLDNKQPKDVLPA